MFDNGNFAWNMFAQTGQIGYYLLYKELNGEHENERDKRFD